MSYITDPLLQSRSDLQGLTLLQINPDIALDFRQNSDTKDWIFEKKDNNWTQLRQLSGAELAEACDQCIDFSVLDASKLKGGWDLPIDQVFEIKHQEEKSKFTSFMKKLMPK